MKVLAIGKSPRMQRTVERLRKQHHRVIHEYGWSSASMEIRRGNELPDVILIGLRSFHANQSVFPAALYQKEKKIPMFVMMPEKGKNISKELQERLGVDGIWYYPCRTKNPSTRS